MVRLLAEQLFGKVPVIIIDQEGEFATLREKFDYILVGKGGEAAATTQSAGLLSHRLLQLRASAVCDLYDLDIPTRKTWIRKFFEGVMSAPKKFWRPTVFIIDEAHDFIPEKMESECAHILASAISKGRKRGFAFVCATQRLSKLNKDVASELQNVLIGKTWLDIDRERGASALGIYSKQDKEEFYDHVKRLEQGEFYAQGAAISLDRILFQTGSIQTTHPDSSNVKNKKKWLVPPPTPKAVAALLGKLGDLPKDAAEEAQTISEFKHQIIQLKHDLHVSKASVPRAVASVLPVSDHGAMAGIQKKFKACQKDLEMYKVLSKAMAAVLNKKEKQMASAAAALLEGTKIKIPKMIDLPRLSEVKHVQTQYTSAPHVVHKPVSFSAPVFKPKASEAAVPEGAINNKQRAILIALAEFRAIGRMAVPRNWIAARSGASHRSSAYANNVSNLRSRGYIEYTGEGLALTLIGEEWVNEDGINLDTPMDTQTMLQSCLKLLSNKQAAILNYLHGIHPEEAPRDVVAENSGASVLSSAYANNVSALKSAGMIEYTPSHCLKASNWLFID